MRNCPICDNANNETFVDFDYGEESYTLMKCTDCACIYYKEDFYFDFKENFEHNRNLKTYLEKTLDLENLITTVYNYLQTVPSYSKKGVDIGCGAGIVMDFIQSTMQIPMLGFEPSVYYSKEGKDNLGLNIIQDFFDPTYLTNDKCDFALCLQVLQMSDTPKKLLEGIIEILGENGSMLITTPNNAGIEPEGNPFENISILSPGVHRVLFNAKSLSRLLINVGFKSVKVFERDHQLFAIASMEQLPEVDLFISNRSLILNYYSDKLKALQKNTAYFKGIWYRYYRNRIDFGEYEEALILLKSCDWFEAWAEYEIEQIHTLDKLFELNSSADAIIYYYTGILFLNHLHKYDYAEKFFLLSFLLCKKLLQIQPEMCVIESNILWLAKLHNIITKKYGGKEKEANIDIISLVSMDHNDFNGLPRPSSEVIERAQKLAQINF